MARRNRDLAGLAALGALGYAMFGGKGGTRDRDTTAVGYDPEAFPAPAAAQGVDPFLAGELARASRASEGVGLGRAPERQLNRSMAARADEGVVSPRMEMPEETVARVGADAMSRGRRAAPPRRNVQGDYTRTMGATADEIAAYRNRAITPPPMTPEMRRQAEAQAIERVTPEEYLIGGPGLKGLHAAAKGLANRTPAMREVTQQALPAPTPRLTGPSKADLMARDRAAREAARREEMLQENAARYGLDPRAPGYEGAARVLREKLGDSAFTLKKKGGMVKAKAKKMASGGSTSSASKRGDGIAMKGKTKCKMY
jgi:hypothetical protein